jgi:hypothetical protein
VTDFLTLPWPDADAFRGRAGRPIRLLAVSDEADESLVSQATRDVLAPVDVVIGCGDLEPSNLGFLADAFAAPLLYVRGNHDVGRGWQAERHLLPDPLQDGRVHREDGLRFLPFSGSPDYAPHGRPGVDQQVSGLGMWWRVAWAWPRATFQGPLVVMTHAAPRGLNDASDRAHRGFTSFRWLLDRLRPPLWLHGHTALVRRGMNGRTVRHEGTLLVNVTGAMLIELTPPASPATV